MSFLPRMSVPLVWKKPFESRGGRNRGGAKPAPVPAGGRGAAIAALPSILVLPFASPARADLQLDGRWRQGPLREDFTVQQWMPNGCGPTPPTGNRGGGRRRGRRPRGGR